MKKISLTIGIPAFNEEANISHLINRLLGQDDNLFKIDEIIVSSDCSTDNTVELVNSFKSNIIKVIDNKDRKGQAFRQNQIIEMCKSDILILLNADILFEDKFFISKLINPIINNEIDLVSSNLSTVKPRNFLGRVLTTTLKERNIAYESLNNGINLYTCHGAARAFSKPFYKVFRFKNSVAEDAYSYLFCVANGFKYSYVKNAVAFIRWPETFEDHERQSIRFFQSQLFLSKSFDKSFLNQEYKIPINVVMGSAIKLFLNYPVYGFCYVFIFISTYIKSLFSKQSNTWKLSTSSKKLI